MKYEFKKSKEFTQKVKNFNLMKYMLIRKERKLLDKKYIKEALIEKHTFQIVLDRAHATALESEIAILKKAIKQLDTDVEKVKIVLELD